MRQGHANFILDNLIASGKAKPMLVVMAYGYARRAGEQPPDLCGKGFGSPEFRKAMQEMMAPTGPGTNSSTTPGAAHNDHS